MPQCFVDVDQEAESSQYRPQEMEQTLNIHWSWNPWLTDLNQRNPTWPELTNQNGLSFWPAHWPEVNQESKFGHSLHYFYWNIGMIKSGSHFLWLNNPCSPSLDCLSWSCSQGQEVSWGKKTESSKTKNISASFESLDPTWVEFHNLEITVQLASINSS